MVRDAIPSFRSAWPVLALTFHVIALQQQQLLAATCIQHCLLAVPALLARSEAPYLLGVGVKGTKVLLLELFQGLLFLLSAPLRKLDHELLHKFAAPKATPLKDWKHLVTSGSTMPVQLAEPG